MITVIRHGNIVDNYESVCPKCHCFFSYNDFDIEREGSYYDPIYYIKCPDCGYQLIGYTRDKLS